MLIKKLTACLAAIAAFSFSTISAAEDLNESTARIALAKDYIAAYSTFDVTKMEPFYSDDAMFHDPTTSPPGTDGALLLTGKAAILKGLGDYAASFNRFSVEYKIERQYESNGVVVFIAQLSYMGESKDGDKFAGSAPIVTAITVKDGKVVRHTDYFDYKENAEGFSK